MIFYFLTFWLSELLNGRPPVIIVINVLIVIIIIVSLSSVFQEKLQSPFYNLKKTFT